MIVSHHNVVGQFHDKFTIICWTKTCFCVFLFTVFAVCTQSLSVIHRFNFFICNCSRSICRPLLSHITNDTCFDVSCIDKEIQFRHTSWCK